MSFRPWATLIAALLLQMTVYSSLYAQEIKPPGVVIWDGEIAIYRQGSIEYEEEGGKDGHHYRHFQKHVIDDFTTISACGSKEHLHVYSAERKLEDSFEKINNSEAPSTNCGIPEELIKQHGPMYAAIHFDPVIKTPGNSSSRSEKSHLEIDEGKDVFPLKERTRVTLFSMGGAYTLHVQSLATVHILQDYIYESYDACNGKTKRIEYYVLPGGEGEPPSFSTNVTDINQEGPKIARYKLPLIMFPAGFNGEGEVSGSILEGAIEETERGNKVKVKGGYDVKTESTWKFTAKDPCREVYSQLIDDIAFAEAYQNTKHQEDANKINDIDERMKTYHKLVDDHAYRTLYGEEPPEGTLTETNAETGGGELELEEWLKKLKKKLADECKHDIIYKAIEEHEFEHVRQGQTYYQSKYFHGNAVIYGRLEVTAHLIGINILKNWLERNCPEINLSEAKARIKRIEDKIQPRSAIKSISERYGGG